LKYSSCAVALVALLLAIPLSADSRVKIDSVPLEYAPIDSPTSREPVSLSSFHFEVNEEAGRARVVVDYTYPDQMTYGPDDDVHGPRSTVAQIPGLAYDAAAHIVVYDSNRSKAVCAITSHRAGLSGHHLEIKNTGARTVSTVVANYAADTGWDTDRAAHWTRISKSTSTRFPNG
jgi:hypothetical protein